MFKYLNQCYTQVTGHDVTDRQTQPFIVQDVQTFSENNNSTSCSPPYDDLSKGYSVYAALIAFIVPIIVLIFFYFVITIKMRSKTKTKIRRIKSKITSTAWISSSANQNHNFVYQDSNKLKVFSYFVNFLKITIYLHQRFRNQDLKMQFPSLTLRMRPQEVLPDQEVDLCTQTRISRLLT